MKRWIDRGRLAIKDRRTNALGVLEACFQKIHVLTTSTSTNLTNNTDLKQVQQWFQERNEILDEQRHMKLLKKLRNRWQFLDPNRRSTESNEIGAFSQEKLKIDSSGFDTCDAQLLQEARKRNFFGMYELSSSPYYHPNIFWNHCEP
ncbi:hypothetical protein CAEBREN_14433 [Caenorhabditis brenneri]|uniref:Uncharacterized protein n=1 Tax=Caenorhabditis brenneri TaxID=135651 RepID=G0NGK1_CAEBE|nr:hypothetical protein CAEBREN_14433 [Caenorhabditis brenneri]